MTNERAQTGRSDACHGEFLLVVRNHPGINGPAAANHTVREAENLSEQDAPPNAGFQVSDQPVVRTAGEPLGLNEGQSAGLPSAVDADLLYVIARDPTSLFLYWEANWTRLFAQAGLSAREINLRVFRADGSIEKTQEINPFRGHCYVEVSAAGQQYHCELGCFDGEIWRNLVRSGKTFTPEGKVSDDFSAEFATLPIHLSFQRMLDLFHARNGARDTLANSVAKLQEKARVSPDAIAPGSNGNGADAAGLAALLQAALKNPRPGLTPDQRRQWRELGERLGGASWGGASENDFGGSSPA
ncbi:MAG: DUF4912 domain-containing protein [Spartobacteria bacterium]